MAKRNFSLDREARSYLRPRTYMMFMADTKMRLQSKSSFIDDLVTKYYESLPIRHQQELLDYYKNHDDVSFKFDPL